VSLSNVHLKIRIARWYRVLVDRMWPRGRMRKSLRLDRQAPELVPSVALGKWFSADINHWIQFQACYERELKDEAMQVRKKSFWHRQTGVNSRLSSARKIKRKGTHVGRAAADPDAAFAYLVEPASARARESERLTDRAGDSPRRRIHWKFL
jgi:uncharacterized protein YeaO (DUF488 family)